MAEALKYTEVFQGPDLATQRLQPLDLEAPLPQIPKSISAVTAHLLGAWLCQVDAWNWCEWLFVFLQALMQGLECVFEHLSRNVASHGAACTIPGKLQTR